jgi:hypothetical protein
MKKKKIKQDKSARRFRRLPIMIVAGIAVIVIAAITVVSRQSANSTATNGPAKTTDVSSKKFTTIKVAGQEVQVDSQGKIKPLSPEEAKKLADGLKDMLNKSSAGLTVEHKPDGSDTVDLQDRFQNVVVARENQDGTITQSCVDNPRAAANFFGIDPKLLERDQPTSRPPVN